MRVQYQLTSDKSHACKLAHHSSLVYTDLHGHWKIILRLRRKKHVNGFFLEWCVAGGWCSNFDDMKFPTSWSSHGKAKEGALLLVSLQLELAEGGGVALDGLGHIPLDAKELHGANHTVILSRDTNQEKPVHGFVSAVVNDLQ